jgi:hypothetical protein
MRDEDFQVACVRGLAVEKIVAKGRAPQFFADAGKLREAEAQTIIFARELRSPQSQSFDALALLLKRREQLAERAT